MSETHRYELRLAHSKSPGARVSFWVGAGKRAYLWVGTDGHCFGFRSGPRTLEKFARALLAEVAEPERRKAKLKRKVAKRVAALTRASGGRKAKP